MNDNKDWWDEADRLKAEKKILLESLEFYASANYCLGVNAYEDELSICNDCGRNAREALKKVKGDTNDKN